MTTPLDLFGGGIAAAAAKLKLEALSYSVRNDLDNRVLICTLSLPRHFPLPPQISYSSRSDSTSTITLRWCKYQLLLTQYWVKSGDLRAPNRSDCLQLMMRSYLKEIKVDYDQSYIRQYRVMGTQNQQTDITHNTCSCPLLPHSLRLRLHFRASLLSLFSSPDNGQCGQFPHCPGSVFSGRRLAPSRFQRGCVTEV